MNPGRLNNRLIIETPVDAKDPGGQPVRAWTQVATVWADIVHASGIETVKAGAASVTTRASIRIRYRADVTPAMRARHVQRVGGVDQTVSVYNIVDVLPDKARRQHCDLIAERVR